MPKSIHCPKCNRRLKSCGEVVVGHRFSRLDLFMCMECMATYNVDGEPYESYLMFAVGEDGIIRDADTYAPKTMI